ncbi:MAG: universal stress protein [Bdellovibrionota bacterium]|nr:MAG: universal stress protein [Bdellovibrionota bacterium]
MYFKNILVPTDFSDASRHAFTLARYHAEVEQAHLHLLTIIQSPLALSPYDLPLFTTAQAEIEQEMLGATNKKLKETAEEFFAGLPVTTHTEFTTGNIGDEICSFAKEHHIDLVVIAGQGHGALSRFVLGSVTDRVVRTATCPVLVVPWTKTGSSGHKL